MKKHNISRREFLKAAGVTGVGAASAWLLGGQPARVFASAEINAGTLGVLVDVTRCVGCDSCALACKEINGLSNPQLVPDALRSDAYTFVDVREVDTSDGQRAQRFVKRQCMHCLNAACVAACPAAAMYKDVQGPVIYRSYRCLGCRYCQAACPFSIPRFEWENGMNPTINKCWFCYERLQGGGRPACVEACPTGALRFGLRNELLAQAHAKIESNHGCYVDHVFGEHEVGGTAMLYLSDVPFEELGFPTDLPSTAPPEATHKVISKLPFVLTGMTAFMVGAAAYTHRPTPETEVGDGGKNHGLPPAPSEAQED